MHFKLNEPHVVGELMDGEFVLVDFETGCYYSIRETAADICNLLFAGHAVSAVIEQLARRHGTDQTTLQLAVDRFVQQMLAEGLIVPAAESTPGAEVALCSSSFEAPVLEKFDDMADQLLLDPIHEIDEQGWPQRGAA